MIDINSASSKSNRFELIKLKCVHRKAEREKSQ